jgi:teichoic acid transport system permease protein
LGGQSPRRRQSGTISALDTFPNIDADDLSSLASVDDGKPEVDEAAALRPMHAFVSTGDYLTQMWDRRSFASAMPFEEIRSSHQDTLLGNAWHLLNPMLSVGVYYLVFAIFLNARGGIDNYVLWLTVGVFTFGLTSRSVLAGATAITSNVGLMRSMRFPRALLPVSAVFGRLVTFGFELAVLFVVAVLTGGGISQRIIALPLILAAHTGFNIGLALIAARLNDSYRDVQQLIPFLFRLLMYMSGVMFPVRQYIDNSDAPGIVSRVVSLNPMVQILDLYRWVFLGGTVDLWHTAQFLLITALLIVFGFRFFRVKELAYGRA